MATAPTALAPVPAHIRPEWVYDFDFIDNDEIRADVHEAVQRTIREAPPVFFTPRNGGHWVLRDHAAIFEAGRDPETFGSSKLTIPPIENEPLQLPLSFDPPEHTPYRAILSRAFAPKVIMAMEQHIRQFAVELIDAVIDQGRCDFVGAVAEPLPVTIFMKLMGMPLERMAEFRAMVVESLQVVETRDEAWARITEEMTTLIRARQAKPEDDLLTTLVTAEVDGKQLSLEQVQAFCLLLVAAGLDSVMNAMAFGIRHLARHPDDQAWLRANPQHIVSAAEEFLRRYTFTCPVRVTNRDTDFRGVHMKQGDRVLFLLSAANLDAQVFPEPLKVDIERENKAHIAFNVGPHRCVGSHLARLELRILYEEWLKRVPEFRLDPEGPATRFHGANVMGPDVLWIRWD